MFVCKDGEHKEVRNMRNGTVEIVWTTYNLK